jgi:translation initiation factor 1A
MTINRYGGKKAKKASRFKLHQANERSLIYKDEDQDYGQVIQILGDMRCQIKLLNKNNDIIIGHIRGKLKKRCWINNGDYVLISYREYQKDKCDIIHKYTDGEISLLIDNNDDYNHQENDDEINLFDL